MKLYLNLDLNINKLAGIMKEFSFISNDDDNYLKYGALNNRDIIKAFVEDLDKNETLYLYDFSSLELNLNEFKALSDALGKKNVEIIFLKETEEFKLTLNKILENEHNIFSRRTTNAIKKAKNQGKVLGRPKINNVNRDKMYYLYTQKKMSMRQIALSCNVSLGTVHKYINQVKEEGNRF